MEKILWLVEYPINKFRSELHLNNQSDAHSFGWMINLQDEIAKIPNLELSVVSVTNKISRNYNFKQNGVNYYFIKTSSFIKRILGFYIFDIIKIRKLIHIIKPDIIHVHGTEYFYGLVPINLKIPYVISIQGVMSEIYKAKAHQLDLAEILWFIQTFFEKRIIKKAENFLVRTDFDSGFVSQLNKNANLFKCWEVLEGAFFKVERKIENIEQKIIFLGGTASFKGFSEVVNAFSSIASEFNNIELLIAGNTVEKKKNTALSGLDSKITRRIIFLGNVKPKELAKLYETVSLFINASYNENSSNAICEAMVAGLPIIATNVGGTPSVMEIGEGMLVKSKNSELLAFAISKVLKDYQNYFNRAVKASFEARKRHNSETITRKTIEIYNSIIKR